MARLRHAALLTAGLGAAVVAVAWYAQPPSSPPSAAPLSRAQAAQTETPAGRPIASRWIVAGGGPTPASNEISIEDDIALAARIFGGPGVLLYAGGTGTRAVRTEADHPQGDPLVATLARIFDPQGSRQSEYRATRLQPDDAATRETFLGALREQLARTEGPLTVWVSGHGDRGATPADNGILLWGNDVVTPTDLARVLREAEPKRRTRFVVTTCFSGGFAEIAFADAVPASGAIDADVCGLFASTADREAGGCDPNPARGAHDGYAVHFLNALAGSTRTDEPLSMRALDFDRDESVSLLDAHTWARLSSGSIDVPMTTSERWLRSVAVEEAAAPLAMPHEDAVIAALESRLDVRGEAATQERLASLDAKIAALAAREQAAAEREAAVERLPPPLILTFRSAGASTLPDLREDRVERQVHGSHDGADDSAKIFQTRQEGQVERLAPPPHPIAESNCRVLAHCGHLSTRGYSTPLRAPPSAPRPGARLRRATGEVRRQRPPERGHRGPVERAGETQHGAVAANAACVVPRRRRAGHCPASALSLPPRRSAATAGMPLRASGVSNCLRNVPTNDTPSTITSNTFHLPPTLCIR